jgi:hypothetical protein
MNDLMLAAGGLAGVGAGFALHQGVSRGLNRWMVSYLAQTRKRLAPQANDSVHVLLCLADHFEPRHGNVTASVANARLMRWIIEYPRLFAEYRDSDGQPPRHTFFYPLEKYDREEVHALSQLCRAGYGEIEVHHHHECDTPESLRARLTEYKDRLCREHGVLARDRHTGAVTYGFVHGDWALDNSHPKGLCCGVNNELDILRETGCYADFTMPSAPDPTQTRKINSIYYACDDPQRPKSHDDGVDLGTAPAPSKSLMLIQGPLLLDWQRRKWGLLPRIENGCLQHSQPPNVSRLDLWLKSRVQVPTRLDWFFVKLHTHGGIEPNQRVLLGEPMITFHRALALRRQSNPNFHFHYVTAREMYNLARAAEDGWQGTVDEARDYQLILS